MDEIFTFLKELNDTRVYYGSSLEGFFDKTPFELYDLILLLFILLLVVISYYFAIKFKIEGYKSLAVRGSQIASKEKAEADETKAFFAAYMGEEDRGLTKFSQIFLKQQRFPINFSFRMTILQNEYEVLKDYLEKHRIIDFNSYSEETKDKGFLIAISFSNDELFTFATGMSSWKLIKCKGEVRHNLQEIMDILVKNGGS